MFIEMRATCELKKIWDDYTRITAPEKCIYFTLN